MKLPSLVAAATSEITRLQDLRRGEQERTTKTKRLEKVRANLAVFLHGVPQGTQGSDAKRLRCDAGFDLSELDVEGCKSGDRRGCSER